MGKVLLVVAAALTGAFTLTPVCPAETVYSEDFTLLLDHYSGYWRHDTDCPPSQAPGHSAPDVFFLGPDCEGGIGYGVATTPQISTDGTCNLSFNYFLDFDYSGWQDVDFKVAANDEVLVSSSDSTLANSATWTTIEGLGLPAGGVVIEFIGDIPYSSSGQEYAWGRGFTIDDLEVDCPGSDEPVYSEEFGLDIEIYNVGTYVGWERNISCPSSQEPGHSTSGVLRWGSLGFCGYRGLTSNPSAAAIPSISTTGDCTLGFKYLLDCCELWSERDDPCGERGCRNRDWATCDIEGTFEVRANGTVLASYADGSLVNNGTWTTVEGLELPPGDVAIDFMAAVVTSSAAGSRWDYVDPVGSGFLIDDITVDCPAQDDDADGILNESDLCPGTAIPESVPTNRLGVNRWALADDDGEFDTASPLGGGPGFEFSLTETRGCSCEQIIEAMALGWGHTKFGCSTGVLLNWIATRDR